MSGSKLQQFLIDYVSKVSGLPSEQIDARRSFSEYGLTSIDGVRLARELRELLAVPVPATVVWDYIH